MCAKFQVKRMRGSDFDLPLPLNTGQKIRKKSKPLACNFCCIGQIDLKLGVQVCVNEPNKFAKFEAKRMRGSDFVTLKVLNF